MTRESGARAGGNGTGTDTAAIGAGERGAHGNVRIQDLTDQRMRAMLQTAFGPAIVAALADPRVIEIMVNPDGVLRVDRLGEGRVDTLVRIEPERTERIIRLVASHARSEAHTGRPIISAELPAQGSQDACGGGERFEGVLPPVATGPCFAIRKPAARIHTLDDYVADGIMPPGAATLLRTMVAQQRNILVVGGTSSGKTTLANALLAELVGRDERVVLIEDTRELRSPVADTVALRTRQGTVSVGDLVRSTLRLRPDRIIVGEVRGSEALEMLKAWNTGHPGGVATIHANSAGAALHRLENLVQEAVAIVPRRLIAEAIDVVVFICGRGLDRRVAAIDSLEGIDAVTGDYRLRALLEPPSERDPPFGTGFSRDPCPSADLCPDPNRAAP